MYNAWLWRSTIVSPDRAAALNNVVDAEHMPPPSAPCSTMRPPRRTPPIRYGGLVTGETARLKENFAPGRRMVPSIFSAGIRMLTPPPLDGPGTKRVVHRASSDMFAGRAAFAIPPGATTAADSMTRVTLSDRTRARPNPGAV